MFGRQVITPEIGRKPIYDSVYDEAGRYQSFLCASCNTHVALDVVKCIGMDSHDPESVLGPDQGEHIRTHFGILNKSLANGWPFVSVASCPACAEDHLVYIAVFEPRNGWQQAVLQGITQFQPSNTAVQRTASPPTDL
jgi:hypothetical protein